MSRRRGEEPREWVLAASGFRWGYVAYAPRPDDGRRPLPVVLLLHGSGGSGRNFLDQANWATKAEEGGFLVVAPDAQPLRPWRAVHWFFNPRVWNSGRHEPGHPRGRVDDHASVGGPSSLNPGPSPPRRR